MIKELEPPDTHHLSAALGWLGLGNAKEAEKELERISPDFAMHPDVLEARWFLCAEGRRWQEGLEIARALLQSSPERPTAWLNQAYALRRVPDGGLRQAWDALLPAFDKFPKEPTVAFNLACYACQMNELDAARIWFKRAVKLAGKEQMKRMALADPDMKPLWDEIRQL